VPRRGTKPMGDMERPSPGHGGRTNPTRRRMKALKSTFTAPGAALKRTSAERRATGEAPSGLRIGRKEPCGPTTVAIGAIRWPLRTGSDAGSSPGGERELFSEIEARPPMVCLRVHRRETSEIVADPGEERRRRPRTRPGAHRDRGREPSGARLRERTGKARANGVGVSRRRTRAIDTARASSDRPGAGFRAVTARSRFDPVGRRGASLTTCRTRAERRATHAGSARAPATTRGPRRGASSGPVGGRPLDPGWTRRRGPSRTRPPARRSASSACRRGEPRP